MRRPGLSGAGLQSDLRDGAGSSHRRRSPTCLPPIRRASQAGAGAGCPSSRHRPRHRWPDPSAPPRRRPGRPGHSRASGHRPPALPSRPGSPQCHRRPGSWRPRSDPRPLPRGLRRDGRSTCRPAGPRSPAAGRTARTSRLRSPAFVFGGGNLESEPFDRPARPTGLGLPGNPDRDRP